MAVGISVIRDKFDKEDCIKGNFEYTKYKHLDLYVSNKINTQGQIGFGYQPKCRMTLTVFSILRMTQRFWLKVH